MQRGASAISGTLQDKLVDDARGILQSDGVVDPGRIPTLEARQHLQRNLHALRQQSVVAMRPGASELQQIDS